ncbi:hypothetical protein BS297_06990 [Rhodococcus erythropolis]|uniref:DUF3556 domain-containing protein n=1 Tax=Rhodococcus erythropolis TaxID=1833 RepID=A0A5N5E9U3_RHOER|nr:hypothetical protein BS297_06990 [Rhodococcus erythropolis]
MGFKNGDVPNVDFATFGQQPTLMRYRQLATHWVEYGFGTAKQTHMLYVIKMVFYVAVGASIASLSSGLGAPWHVDAWWTELIFYQKLIAWTIFFEILGVGASSGPLAFRFSPMIGGFLYWLRPGTIRVPPWPNNVPFTRGDNRSLFDVIVYVLILINLIFILALPGVNRTDAPADSVGLVDTTLLYPLIAFLVIMGLRDKVVFLASRPEQYIPALLFFAFFSYTDIIVSLKLLIVVVWVGAGVSKFGRHFANVVPPMLSNAPVVISKRFKRSLYRDFPNDLRPSHVGSLIAHIGGTFVEIVVPIVLLLSTNLTVVAIGIFIMIGFHLVITSTFPLAVPLEWNLLFTFAAWFLFWGFPAGAGYAVTDLSSIWLTIGVFAGLLFFPVLGNLRPDLVSFLPSMRQYAGNWASTTWAFAPGVERRMNEGIKSSANQVDQLAALYGLEVAEVFMQMAMGWRTLHSQGRALVSLMINTLDDIDRYSLREGEFVCATLTGWQFGDGHLHDERAVAAVQRRCNFAPGELIVAFTESQPIHRNRVNYRVIDAALGIIETGSYLVKDATEAQPWLPDGPIPFDVTYSRPKTVVETD